MNVLVVVNTFRRPQLLRRVLDRIFKYKQQRTRIAVVEDGATWMVQDARVHHYWPIKNRVGLGLARRYAMKKAAETYHNYIHYFIDDDVFVRNMFDVTPLRLFVKYQRRHHGCIGSAYTQNCEWHEKRQIDFGNYYFGTSAPGSAIFMRPTTTDMLIHTVPKHYWSQHWDWMLFGFVNGCIRPKRSFVRNVRTGNPA